jgi:membrane-associated phospholipid phosphatase
VAIGLVAVVALSVALARMYRGMHFLSDVVAGAVLGAISVAVAAAILGRTEQGRAVRARIGAHEENH